MGRPKTIDFAAYAAAVDDYIERYDAAAFAKALGLSDTVAEAALDGAALTDLHERLSDDAQRLLYLSRQHRAPGRTVRFLERIVEEAKHPAATAHRIAAKLGAPLGIVRDVLERRAYVHLFATLGGTRTHHDAWLRLLRGGAREEAARGPRW